MDVHEYANGVIDERLPAPDGDVALEPDWALQDPEDYLETFRRAVPRLVARAGIEPGQVVGIGIDFTSCTMLPTTADGTPLCFLDAFRREPHAWVKLWKHHAAQPEADDINRVAAETGQPWLERYGGKISSEWFFPKALQILREAPHVYRAADRLIEAADWAVWQLTGRETRNNCTAGYKAIWSAEDGFPDPAFFEALEPGFRDVVDEKMSRTIDRLGDAAGRLSDRAAAWTGLPAGIAVAVANVDAHVSVPAAAVTEPGTMVAIMGTSICDIVLADSDPAVRRHVRRRARRRDPRAVCLRGRPGVGRRPVRMVRRARGPARVPRAGTRARRLRARGPRGRGRPAAPRRVGDPGPRLVERQSLGPRRRGPVRVDRWADGRHGSAGDLPRADRGDRVRDAGHRRGVPGRWRGRRQDRRVRRTA